MVEDNAEQGKTHRYFLEKIHFCECFFKGRKAAKVVFGNQRQGENHSFFMKYFFKRDGGREVVVKMEKATHKEMLSRPLMKGLACHGLSDCLGGQFGTFGDSGQKVEETSVLGFF